MRTFLVSTILLCIFGGIYLLQGPSFFMPARNDPSIGIMLSGHSSQLLGAGLLSVAVLGLMAVRQAGNSGGRSAPRVWQIRFFALTVVALALITSAFLTGAAGPNPEARHRDTAKPSSAMPQEKNAAPERRTGEDSPEYH